MDAHRQPTHRADPPLAPTRARTRPLTAILASLILLLGGVAGAAPAWAADADPGSGGPLLSGPVTGGARPFPFGSFAALPDSMIAEAGYVEREYFLSGVAQAYAKDGTWASDGRWPVVPATTAAYKTRLFVEKPADAARFNGTVVVEWLNVTAGIDLWADFAYAHQELLRKGYAYVGVSAQKVGVDALKTFDPTRYGTLSQPGDAFSYDIFSQAAAAVRDTAGPLSGLSVKRVLADGESQSASRMVTYINAVHPVAQAYDGFLVHSRAAGGAPISDDPATGAVPTPAFIRPDVGAPVLQVQSETDVEGFVGARQPDTSALRTWELAGTSHLDFSVVQVAAPVLARDAGALLNGCDKPVNNGEQRYVMNAAVRSLSTWAAGGAAPATAPPVSTVGAVIQRDPDGNALGGLRTPGIDVPIATYSGRGNGPLSLLCLLAGTTTYFTGDKLAQLYPTHEIYTGRVTAAADAAVAAGHLLPEDARRIIADAVASPIGL